ncbi:hypothetical protein ACJJTC_010291 [Scirpophaga incertulas]
MFDHLKDLLFKNKQGKEDCLIANIYVPDTVQKNLPVLVYVHGGGFGFGHGNFVVPKIVQSHNIIVVTFNYRLGVNGFLCLGTPSAPGNAGMKDQVALLRWVKRNIEYFGGNPDDVTIAGSSAGSASVDLLMLSPITKGLFNKVIPESGANLGLYAIQLDPIENAREFAKGHNFSGIYDARALESFYKTASVETVISNPLFARKDSKLFSPCIERDVGEEIFLAENPYDILNNGNYEKIPMLYGFANMEGIAFLEILDAWKNDMNNKFSNFLPMDLQLNEVEKTEVASRIKEFYFGEKEIGYENVLGFIDYMTDTMFMVPVMRAIQLHVKAGHKKIFLYEYSYTDETAPLVPHTNVRGATHCAQSIALVDDSKGFSNVTCDEHSPGYIAMKHTIREIWSNFIKTGSPVPEGSLLPSWPPTGSYGNPYMSLGRPVDLVSRPMHEKRFRIWEELYKEHYRAPTPPPVYSRDEL